MNTNTVIVIVIIPNTKNHLIIILLDSIWGTIKLKLLEEPICSLIFSIQLKLVILHIFSTVKCIKITAVGMKWDNNFLLKSVFLWNMTRYQTLNHFNILGEYTVPMSVNLYRTSLRRQHYYFRSSLDFCCRGASWWFLNQSVQTKLLKTSR